MPEFAADGNGGPKPLHLPVRPLADRIDDIQLAGVPRARHTDADQLAKRAMGDAANAQRV